MGVLLIDPRLPDDVIDSCGVGATQADTGRQYPGSCTPPKQPVTVQNGIAAHQAPQPAVDSNPLVL